MTLGKLRKGPSGKAVAGTPGEGQVITTDSNGELTWRLPAIAQATNAPHGWSDPTELVATTGASRTFTLAPAGSVATYWRSGSPQRYTASQSVVWPNSQGIHFFYLDTAGILQTTQTSTTWEDAILGTSGLIPVWALYWSVSLGIVLRDLPETHTAEMNGRTHLHLHNGVGTRRYSGGLLAGFTIGDGSLNTHAQCSAGSVTIADEDLVFTFTDGVPQDLTPILQSPVFYLDGSSLWKRKTADGYPLLQGNSVPENAGDTRPSWNQLVGANWQLTETAINDYVLMHVMASTDRNEPLMTICGQATYLTLATARNGAHVEFQNLRGLVSLLSTEYTPLGSIIFQAGNYANAVKARVVLTDLGTNYLDIREGPR